MTRERRLSLLKMLPGLAVSVFFIWWTYVRVGPSGQRGFDAAAFRGLHVEAPLWIVGVLIFGVAGYSIVRDSEAEADAEVARITNVNASARGYANYQQWVTGSKLEQKISLEDYSVSNRGLKAGFVGTPQRVKERMEEFAAVGVDLVLLQSSPQAEEMERFSAQVIRPA